MARRWVAEFAQRSDTQLPNAAATLAPAHTNRAFIPVKLQSMPSAPTIVQADIRMELRHGATTMHIHWPVSASSQCAQWLRQVLA